MPLIGLCQANIFDPFVIVIRCQADLCDTPPSLLVGRTQNAHWMNFADQLPWILVEGLVDLLWNAHPQEVVLCMQIGMDDLLVKHPVVSPKLVCESQSPHFFQRCVSVCGTPMGTAGRVSMELLFQLSVQWSLLLELQYVCLCKVKANAIRSAILPP